METFPGVFQIRIWLLMALFCLAMMILLAKVAGASTGRVYTEAAKEKMGQGLPHRGYPDLMEKKQSKGLTSPEQVFFTLSLQS